MPDEPTVALISPEQQRRAKAVQQMFGAIAPRYDLLNHLLSANVDKRWRKACAQALAERRLLRSPKVLDVGCGTGDLALDLAAVGSVVGCDFSLPMLQIGRQKLLRYPRSHPIRLLSADAHRLPFRDKSFDIVVSAFVVRNLANIEVGLSEMRRVLRAGGMLGLLDFGMPRQRILGALYRFYFTQVLPRVGALVSGVQGPYSYLPASVQAFPPPEEFSQKLASAGFCRIECRPLSAGIVNLYLADSGS